MSANPLTGKGFAALKELRRKAAEARLTTERQTGIPVSLEVVETKFRQIQTGIPASGGQTGIPVSHLNRNIHHAFLAQDGHSAREQQIYDTLWRMADGNGDYRIVKAGYGEISRRCGSITTNNVKSNLRSLERKLALEQIATGRGTEPNTYRLYSYATILAKRKSMGMTHFVKVNSGCEFVDPLTGIPVSPLSRDKRVYLLAGTPPPLTGIPASGGLSIRQLIKPEEGARDAIEEANKTLSDPGATEHDREVALALLGMKLS